MRLQGGVGKIPFSLSFKKKMAFLFVKACTHTQTHTPQASNWKKLSLSNRPQITQGNFPISEISEWSGSGLISVLPLLKSNPLSQKSVVTIGLTCMAFLLFDMLVSSLSCWLKAPQELGPPLILLINPPISQSSWHPRYLTQTLNKCLLFSLTPPIIITANTNWALTM